MIKMNFTPNCLKLESKNKIYMLPKRWRKQQEIDGQNQKWLALL